jgi:hypothetical protein
MALFLASSLALAQVTPTAKITGRVTDAQGAPLPGVSVTGTSPKLVGKAATVTDAEGDFRLFSLPSGIYEVVFSLQGFKTLKREGIVVQLSQEIVLNVKLEQAAIEEQVTVTGMSPLIDVKSTVKGQVMTKEVFMSLPRSRSFDGLLSTAPGVQYDQNTGGLSVDGATGTENMWYMDGSDVTQMHVGTLSQGAVMELVEEVKVTASGYNAEFGGSMGGVVNVITRSGGNAFHGDLYGYYNDNGRLMQGFARQYRRWKPLDIYTLELVNDDDLYYQHGYARDPYKRYEAVFNLGGYIIKDMLWFFGSFNPVYSHQGASRFFLSDPAPQQYYPFSNRWWVWNGQFKLTAAPIKGLRLSASMVNNFSNYLGAIPSRDGTSAKNYAYANQGYSYPNISGAITADYSMGNNFLASFRGGYHMTNTDNQRIANRFTTYAFSGTNSQYATDPFYVANPSLLHPNGWLNYGGAWLVTERYKLEKTSANLDATYYLSLGGEHAWKAGVQMVRDHEDVFNAAPFPHVNISWNQACTALAAYHPGDPAYDPSFRGTYGFYTVRSSFTSPYGYAWNIKRTSWALYLQDSWTVMGKLTINAGVRTESEYIPNFNAESAVTNPKPIKFPFSKKFAPRVGAVYDVFGDSTLKVFATFGIYYDVMKLYQAEGSFGGFKWKTDYYTLDNPNYTLIAASGLLNDAPSQAAGGTYKGTIDFRMPSFDTLDPGLKPVSQREISFGAEKKLMEDLSLSVRLVQKHLIRTIEDIGFISPGGELYYLSNPGSAYVQQALLDNQGPGFWAEPKAKREYYGMNLTLEKRFSHNWQGGINYTLSRVKGNYGGLSSTDEGGRNSPNVERYFDFWFMMYKLDGTLLDGPLPQDRTHYIKAYGSYAFPFGLTIGVAGYARSGLPISTQLAVNNAYMYPNGYGDLGRLPWTVWADLYVEQTIKIAGKYNLGLNVQINNVTNTSNWITADQSPTRIGGGMAISNAQFLSKTFDYRAAINAAGDPFWKNIDYGNFTSRFGTWSARFGVKFSF